MPVFQLTDELIFPPPEFAEADGLLAVGGDLSPERLLLAYRSGIFPWFSEKDPILWWSPAPRSVIEPAGFKTPKRLARFIRKNPFRVTMDTAFHAVIAACAEGEKRREKSTWITAEMIAAYQELHKRGHAHSVECWQGDDLVGGLYGVALGGVFFGESMFHRVSNASKVALYVLVQQLIRWRFVMIDCQVMTGHLLQFGAYEVPRGEFDRLLAEGLSRERRKGKWRLEELLIDFT